MNTPHQLINGSLCLGCSPLQRWVDTREIMGELNIMRRCMELFRDGNSNFTPARVDEFLHEAIESHARLGQLLKELRPVGEMPEDPPRPDMDKEEWYSDEDEWESDYQSQWGLYEEEKASSNK